MMRRTISTGLVAGLLMNTFGWLGNQLWLGAEWNAGIARSAFAVVRERSLWNELGSLMPDFVYGLALAALCLLGARSIARTRGVAYGMAVGLWVVAIATPLFGTANASLMPWRVTLLTTLLALAIMLPVAEFVFRRLVLSHPVRSESTA